VSVVAYSFLCAWTLCFVGLAPPGGGEVESHTALIAPIPLYRMAKDGENDDKDKGKDAGLRGLALAELVMEIIEKSGFFPALGQCSSTKGVQGLQRQLQACKPSSSQLDVLYNLVSPFLLLAAAEKM